MSTTHHSNNTKIKLLLINGCGKVEGDISTALLLLRYLSRSLFDIYVVTKPRGEVYEELKKIPQITLVSMEIGGEEARKTQKRHIFFELLETASALLKIVSFVKKERIDVIYAIDRGIAPKIAAITSLLTGSPFVLCAAYPFYPQSGLAARFVLRQAIRVLAHSEYLRFHLLPHVRHPDCIEVIPNGVEIEKYHLLESGDSLRKQLDIDDKASVIVMMGRLNQYKGQDDLIKAARIVLQQHPNTHFLISGRGPEEWKTYLETLIADYNISNRVRFVGYVPSLPQLIALSDIVAMPSWEEPFGLVALEGMAMAKPVVSTRAGGVPEFLIDNEMGLLVEPRHPEQLAHALTELLSNPQRAQDMGSKGRHHVESCYTAHLYADRMSQAIRRAVHPS